MRRLIMSALCLFVTSPAVSLAQTQSPSASAREPEITAGGRGEVRLPPTYAYVQLGVTTQSQSAGETVSQNAVKIAATIKALHSMGLTEQQVTTSGYSLSQSYEYPKNAQPKLSGFIARNTIRAEVRHLEDLGKVIDAAVSAGATDVSSIQYLVSNTEDARRTALADAVKHARDEADVIARAAGGTLGRLIAVNSGGVAQPGYNEYQPMILASSSASVRSPTPIVPGELTVAAQVFARWEFLPGPVR
jgi:uncharacterized protein